MLLPGLGKDDIPVGRFLGLNTWVDLRNGFDEDPEALQRLVAGAQNNAIDAAAAQMLLAGLMPYRGLLPFREQDAGLFFGRKRFVDELVEKVGRRSDTNAVAVVGRSGSGKSLRSAASRASATSPCGRSSICVPMASRCTSWRSLSTRPRPSGARSRSGRSSTRQRSSSGTES